MKTHTYSTGRRKTSSSRVFLKEGQGKILINKKSLESYFPILNHQKIVKSPLVLTQTEKDFDAYITVKGGGVTGQAEAVRHGLARALTVHTATHRAILKKEGLLTRDPRSVERKKYGRHKARKSTQFSKR